jgi:hypothetical protein
VAILYNTLKQSGIVAVEVRKRKRSGCEKRRRRTCVTEEEAENGLQRTVKLSSRSKTIKQNLWLSS